MLALVDGKIVERGRHAELLRRRGTCYELYVKQSRSQEDGSGNASAATAAAPSPAW